MKVKYSACNLETLPPGGEQDRDNSQVRLEPQVAFWFPLWLGIRETMKMVLVTLSKWDGMD